MSLLGLTRTAVTVGLHTVIKSDLGYDLMAGDFGPSLRVWIDNTAVRLAGLVELEADYKAQAELYLSLTDALGYQSGPQALSPEEFARGLVQEVEKLRARNVELEALCKTSEIPAKPDSQHAENERKAGYWTAFTVAVSTRGATLAKAKDIRGREGWACTIGRSFVHRRSPESAISSALFLEFDGDIPDSFKLPKSTLRPLVSGDKTFEIAANSDSPTAGMTIEERILHVGGRNNAAGYVEFGSTQAVRALVWQVIRDLPEKEPSLAFDYLKQVMDAESASMSKVFAAPTVETVFESITDPTPEMTEAGERAYLNKELDMASPAPTEFPGEGPMGYAWRAMLVLARKKLQ